MQRSELGWQWADLLYKLHQSPIKLSTAAKSLALSARPMELLHRLDGYGIDLVLAIPPELAVPPILDELRDAVKQLTDTVGTHPIKIYYRNDIHLKAVKVREVQQQPVKPAALPDVSQIVNDDDAKDAWI